MTKEEAITALGDRNNFLWGMSKEKQKHYSEALDMAISALSTKLTEKDVKEYCDKHNLTIIDNNYKEEFVRAWCRHNGFLPPRKRKTDKSKLDIKWFEQVGDDNER